MGWETSDVVKLCLGSLYSRSIEDSDTKKNPPRIHIGNHGLGFF